MMIAPASPANHAQTSSPASQGRQGCQGWQDIGPVRSLDGPMTLTIAGKQRVFTTRDGIFEAIRKLEHHEKSLNLQAAYAAFHLGQALLVAKEALRYGAINHLYTDAGINRRRAQRAVKWASQYATPDGHFDLEKYRDGELLARNRHERGQRPCKFDEQGHPSLTAVQEAVGIRSGKSGKKTKADEQSMRAFDPLATLDALADRQSERGHRPEAARRADWVIGDQLAIDFDLLATERKLASAVADAERARSAGVMDDAMAAEINSAIELLAERVIGITQQLDSENQH